MKDKLKEKITTKKIEKKILKLSRFEIINLLTDNACDAVEKEKDIELEISVYNDLVEEACNSIKIVESDTIIIKAIIPVKD